MALTFAALAGLAIVVLCVAFALYRMRARKNAAVPQPATPDRAAPARTPAVGASTPAKSSDPLPPRVAAKPQGPRHAPRRDYWNDMRPRRTFDTARPLKRRAAQRGR